MQRFGFGWFRLLFDMVRSFLRRSEQRRERALNHRWLMEMDDRLLKDIGLSRADIPRLYQRENSAPSHERFEQSSVGETEVRSQVNCCSGHFTPCSGREHRTL